MEHRRRPRLMLAAAGLVAFFLVVLMVFLTSAASVLAQDGDAPDVPGDAEAVIEDDQERGNVESNDDAVSSGDDAGDAAAKDTPHEQWQYISIVVIPLIVQWLKRQEWTTRAKTALMVGLSVIVALGGAWSRGEIDNFAFTATALLQIVIGTQVAYTVMNQLPGVGNLMDGLSKVPTFLPARKSPQ